jgi:N-methylhydantoinase A
VDLGDLPEQPFEMQAVHDLFHAEHARLFGHANRTGRVAIDNLRLQTIGVQAKPSAHATEAGRARVSLPAQKRALRLAGQWHENAPVYAWDDLPAGWSGAGPAIIQKDLATILVPAGYTAMLGSLGDLELVKG